MLYENISYPNNLPFKIFFSNIIEENYHYHKELEMSFILRGTTHYKIHHLDYSLKEGQIIIVDSSDLHRIFGSSDDILMLTLQVDLSYFSNIYPAIDSSIFVCEVPDGKDAQEYQELQNKNKILKRILTKIMIAYQQDAGDELLLSYVETLVSTLVEQFQDFVFSGTLFKPDKRLFKEIDMQRYLKISDYMYTNYQEPISLETISEYLHLSPYYVSHLVKNISGLSFKNYLNYVRVEYSEKMLAEQVLTLTEICETCGFSSLTYFNKCFSLWHGKTPSQYRKEFPNCTRKYAKPFTESEGTDLLLKLNDSYRIINNSTDKLISTATTLPVDFERTEGVPFREKYGFKLLLSSMEDFWYLDFYWDDLASLKPQEVLLKKDLLRSLPGTFKKTAQLLLEKTSCPVTELTEGAELETAAIPLRQLIPAKIPLTTGGMGEPLIYQNGLFSSLFHILRIMGNISGNIISERENSVMIRNKDVIYLLIYKAASQHESSTNVSFKEGPSKVFITEQRFENSTKYRNIINEFSEVESIPFTILNEINASFNNKKTYTLDTSYQDLSISLLKTGIILLKIIPYK